MPPLKDKSDKLRSFIQMANESLTRTEFKEAFANVVRLVRTAEANLMARIDKRLAEIKDGRDGRDGVNGKDGKHGKDGFTPVKGVHYFDGVNGKDGVDATPADSEAIVTRIEQNLAALGTAIRDGLELLQDDDRLDISAIKGLKEALEGASTTIHNYGGTTPVAILQSGTQKVQIPTALNFTGAGAPTITHRMSGVTDLSFPTGGSGGTVYTQTPVGAVDGVNVTYTVSHTINTIYSFANNSGFIHPADYSVTGSTITFVTPLDASLTGLPFTIIYS